MMNLHNDNGRSIAQAIDDATAGALASLTQSIDEFAAVLDVQIARELSTPGTGRFYAKARVTGPALGPQTKAQIRARAFNRKLRGVVFHLNHGAPLDVIGRQARSIHRASSPGDPPAQDTGALKRSRFIERVSAFKRRVGVAMAYGWHLEVGTIRMKPRPYLRPALEKTRKQFRFHADLFSGTIRRAP